jgi:glycosyltransferase involved in cell wall biosynthesis
MKRPLRVVHVTLSLDMGGQEKLLVEIARHTDRAALDLHFVSLTTRGVLADDIEACGWPVTALNAPPGVRPRLMLRLARLFRQLKADVVHTHDDRPNIHGAPAARLAGIRRVIHTRHHQGVHLSRRQQWLVRLASVCNHRFVCISHDSAVYAAQQGIARRRLHVIHNGIDVDRFAYRGPEEKGYAIVVARLAPQKGIHYLLDAVPRIVSQCPDFTLHIAGEGPCRAELEQQTDRLGIRERVQFLGEVHDVPERLAKARLFLLPSLTEGISLTLLEAMARGLPVLTTLVGGNPEVVEDGQTGLLVPPGSVEALAQTIPTIWTSPQMCRRMGEQGRKRVREHFALKQMLANYETIYNTDLV